MRKPRSRATSVDAHVGQRIRMRRTLLGLSQSQLGEALGLTFQQVQKYERGANRIGASRLYAIAELLGVEVSYFFDDLPDEPGVTLPPVLTGHETGGALDVNALNKRETLELVRTYYRIKDTAVRDRLREFVGALAETRGDSSP